MLRFLLSLFAAAIFLHLQSDGAIVVPRDACSDPCTLVANQTFVKPATALACMKSFPFNETLRQNVLTVVSRVFDFYTFEDFYLDLPPPFQASTTDIRAEIARINSTQYEVSSVYSIFSSDSRDV